VWGRILTLKRASRSAIYSRSDNSNSLNTLLRSEGSSDNLAMSMDRLTPRRVIDLRLLVRLNIEKDPELVGEMLEELFMAGIGGITGLGGVIAGTLAEVLILLLLLLSPFSSFSFSNFTCCICANTSFRLPNLFFPRKCECGLSKGNF